MSIQIGAGVTITLDEMGNVWYFGKLFGESSRIPKRIEGLTNIISLCCAKNFYVFVDSNGYVWYIGSLFDIEITEPTKIECLKDIIKVKSGYKHVIFLDSHGKCFGAGGNKSGEIGPINLSNSSTEKISSMSCDKNIIDIACGAFHTIFLTDEGTVLGCGTNTFTQLGNDDRSGIYKNNGRMRIITYPEFIVSICSGPYHTLALSDSGAVWAMGSLTLGKSGINKSSGKSGIPKRVCFPSDVIIKYLEAGPNHSLAIDIENQLWGFGKLFGYDGSGSLPCPKLMDKIPTISTIGYGGQEGIILKTIDNVIVLTDLKFPTSQLGPICKEKNENNFYLWEEEYNHVIGNLYLSFSKQKSARK